MEKSEAIRRATLAVYDAINNHDEVGIKQYFDSGPEHLSVGTGATEVWRGGDVIVRNFAEQFRQMAGLRFTPGESEAFAAGDAGWLFDQPTISAPGMPDTVARLTAVFARDGGDWKIVHSHLSLPSDNA